MNSNEELKSALKESLINRGILNKIKAQMRQEIFEALDNDESQKPNLTKENLIINELIKEYFIYNGYTFSQKVFQSETGQPKVNFNRDNLTKELNIIEDDINKNKPILYSILSGLKNQNDNLIPLKFENGN